MTSIAEQMDSLMRYGERIAQNQRAERKIIMAVRAAEIEKLRAFKESRPGFTRRQRRTAATHPEWAEALAKEAMALLASGGSLPKLAEANEMSREVLYGLMKRFCGYVHTPKPMKAMFTSAQRKLALDLRRDGKTFGEIADALGVSRTCLRERIDFGDIIKPSRAHK